LRIELKGEPADLHWPINRSNGLFEPPLCSQVKGLTT
jgi:hypothetical protein